MTRTCRRRVAWSGLLLMLSAALWSVFGGAPAYAMWRPVFVRGTTPNLLRPLLRSVRITPSTHGEPIPGGRGELGPTGPTGFVGSQECGASGPCDVGAFSSVACGSSTTCTAVGSGINGTLGEDWNGTSWTIDATAGNQSSALSGDWCTSTSACIAVGYSNGQMISEKRSGSRWSMKTIPLPVGATSGSLRQVACSASNACTAVGSAFTSSGEVPLAERWNGASWTQQDALLPPGASNASFSYVWCPGTSACIAVGSLTAGTSGTQTPLAEVWNGANWAVQSTPNPAGAIFSAFVGVSCRTVQLCTAVGWYIDSSNVEKTLAEGWNGTKWSIQSTPNPTGANYSFLQSVSCTSDTTCTAVGASQIGPLAEAWNGTAWSIQPVPTPSDDAGSTALLNDVSCTPANFCMAAGSYTNTKGCGVTLGERWNGSAWDVEPTLSPIGFSNPSLPTGTVGHSYSATPSVCGGPPPYAWSHTGPLPTGLRFNASTGAITATPKYAGTSYFTLTVAQASNPSNNASVPDSIEIDPSKATQPGTPANDGTPMNPPHIAFILVGDWWCAVTGLGSSSLCTFPSGYPYTCPQYSSCKAEGLDFESTENRLVGTDYAAASPYWQQLQLYYCYPALDCAGQSLLRRRYNGQAFYGPITTRQATSPGPTLNSLASGFGIHSQTAASDTVFVFLYGPSLACGQYATTNWGVPGQNGQYGFVYANVVLEDYAKNCVGPIQNGPGNDLNLQSPDPLTPLQFATYATSHEVDEAITSPSDGTNPRGWVVPSESGQLADPCADRTQSGNSLGYDSTANGNNWPYYNFTRDLYGTVVAAFVLFNVNSTPNSCYPDVSTSVPSG